MYNYVYRITNIKDKKHYYGIRKIDGRTPIEDIGIYYFSSSRDKDFIKDQKDNPQNYKYKILKVCDSRRQALELEIKLHDKFNVGVNESFYNRAKQTSIGFDATGQAGVPKTKEHNRKVSEALKGKVIPQEVREKISKKLTGRKHTQESINKMKRSYSELGREPMSEQTKEKISEALTGKKLSEEHKEKIRKNKIGKKLAEEHKEKIRNSAKNVKLKKVKCPFCDKEGAEPAMKSWHFDYCKFNPNKKERGKK